MSAESSPFVTRVTLDQIGRYDQGVTGWLLLSLGAMGVAYAVLLAALAASGWTRARAIGGFVPDCVVLFKRLLRDRRLPRRQKLVLLGLLGYLVTPIDLVPDFIPVAGQLDDAIVAGWTLRFILRGAGTDLITELWPGPADSLRALLRLAGYSAANATPGLEVTR